MRSVILGFLVGWSAWLPAAAQPFAFAEATIDDLQARMAAGTLTARELTARISHVLRTWIRRVRNSTRLSS